MASETTDIDGQAAFWIEQMSRPVQDSAIAAAFDRWILEDPSHVESYARLLALWQSNGIKSALESCETFNGNHDGDPRQRGDSGKTDARRHFGSWSGRPGLAWAKALRPRHLMVLTAVALTLALAVPVTQGLLAPDIAYAAQDGRNRMLDLADGSQIHLRGGSSLSVRLTPWSRTVTLASGEAYFDVAHDRFRRFTVTVGDATVGVLGTAFNVHLTRDGGREVQVYRGLVSVETELGQQRLRAGEGLALSGTGMQMLDVAGTVRPDWIDGWIDAQNTSLAQLVERMNHMADRQVKFADPALGTLRVTGQFRPNEPQEMLEAVAAIHGLSWRDENGTYLLSRSDP
ncbi:MAG: FecR domain-containing protein [Alphaproteobacteria bacterium]|nr:FecR domain-containing protein [Alphaproteobacteria bacterium]MBU0792389.1 FecR domain-containing protein [Alphaproteobacteria bacterium]MBU0877154.1 FecR domain-containing protein [Alphaproteobacteria bacterium]MBU1770728.1 FecR domain-containing protein [Alphaproteobacteria bacterium]